MNNFDITTLDSHKYLNYSMEFLKNDYTVFENFYVSLYLTAFRGKLIQENSIESKEIAKNIESFDLISFAANKKGGWARDKNSKKYFLIDSTFKITKELKFNRAGVFNNSNFFPFQPEQEGQWGYMDAEGNILVSPRYTNAEPFYENFAVVWQNKKRNFINEKGEEVIKFKYSYIGNFQESAAIIVSNKKYGFINQNGIEFIEARPGICYPFKNGFALVDYFKQFHIDKAGNVIGESYDSCWEYSDEYSKVKRNNKIGYKDTKGILVIDTVYDKGDDFSEGFAIVNSENKYYAIDKSGKIAFDHNFEKIGSFKNGITWFLKKDKCGYIDKAGNVLIPSEEYDLITSTNVVDITKEGHTLLRAKKNSKWGFVSPKNEIIIPFSFDNAISYRNDLSIVSKNERTFLIDEMGIFLTDFEYDFSK
jgi:hypothetical protein